MNLSEDGFDTAAYLAGLSDAEWQSHIDDLTDFAVRVVYRFLWRTPSGFPEGQTTEDLVLQSIGGLCHHPERWKHHRQKQRTLEAKLRAYLKMDLYRNMAAQAAGSANATRIPDGDLPLGATPVSGPSPEDGVNARERREFVEEMRRSETTHRELFDLHYLDDLKPAEISERLGIRVALVNSQLGEMRKRLRKRFGARFDEFFPPEGPR
jgi:DNA-directed RNA polymerase specialized sigma24 family protein